MKKPPPFTIAEEREAKRLEALGRSAAWARQHICESRFRRRGAVPAAINREGVGCNRPASQDPASFVNNVLHAPDPIGRKHEGVPEVREELP